MDEAIAGTAKEQGSKQVWILFKPSYIEAMMTRLEKSEYRVLLYLVLKTKLFRKNELLPPKFIKVKKRKLADLLDLSPAGVIKALNGLEDKGFIVSSDDVESTYKLTMPNIDDDDDDYDDYYFSSNNFD